MYYCMTGRAIPGNVPFKIDRNGPTVTARPKGGTIPRSRTEYFPTRGIAIIDLLYDFRISIGTGNNELAIR